DPVAALTAEGHPTLPPNSRLQITTLEEIIGRRRMWSSADIDGLAARAQTMLTALAAAGGRVVLVPYATSAGLERAVARWAPQSEVLGPTAKLRRRLDNKLTVRTELGHHGVDTVRSVAIDLCSISYLDLVAAFGPQVVIQDNVGSSGVGTHIITNADELDR